MKRFLKRAFRFLIRNAKKVLELAKLYLLHPAAWIACRGRTIYLISERGTDARDNGYHMFKYIRTHHPELACFYVIDPASADYEKVRPYGNIVAYRSLRHYLLFIGAAYRISTHIMGFSPDMNLYAFYYQKHSIGGKLIFLQHGVTNAELPQLYWENTKAALFVCGAKPEYDYVSGHFHYRNGEVKYTGFARYDGLQDFQTKRMILLMPTWRQYLQGLSQEECRESAYFTCWNAMLNDERLAGYLERHDLTLLFYPHIEMQKYIGSFRTGHERVVIADFAHYDVQTLLKEAMLLVTDYSSVFFDFAYMRKPCVYYQFDEERYYAGHYHRGYFDYRTMGFGPVAAEHGACVDEIIAQIENGCRGDALYLQRMEAFFPLHDGGNCERIFREIEALR